MDKKSELQILHSYHVWLPLTMSWLYNQVKYLPKSVQSAIYCDRRITDSGYDLPNMYCLEDESFISSRINFYLRKAGLGRYSRHLRKTLREHSFDVIHGHFGNMAWELLPAAKAESIPLITTFYGLDINFLPRQRPVWYKRYPKLFDYTSLVLCEGPHMKQKVRELGCPPEKIVVHHLGIELDSIPFKKRIPDTEHTRILIAGSFREKKGISYALEAIRNLVDEYDISVTIIGDANQNDSNKKEARKIRELMESPDLKPLITHLGFQPHDRLIEEALNHHIFLSPSVTASDGDTEGGAPVVLTEMAATGMPIVSSNHCDIPNIVHHEKNGLLAEERDTDQLATHLRYLIDHPDLWEPMGRYGRQIAENAFDAHKQSHRLFELYSAVINKTQTPKDQNIRIDV